jgi:hypothetical protein
VLVFSQRAFSLADRVGAHLVNTRDQEDGTMKSIGSLALIAIGLVGSAAFPAEAVQTDLDRMPAEIETRFALSALPPALRDQATVYLLDPERGYERSRQGTSGVTCVVQRTVWEMVDFRNDIYIPLCYDAVGTETYLKVIMDAAALRAEGMGPDALKAEIERRFRDETYRAPDKPGLSYMLAPIQRTVGPPDLKVRTLSLPHIMPYAPHVTNEDIGALPDLADHSTLLYPFIDRHGIDDQSYIIQLVGETEKAKILADERTLLDDLCAYRDLLCLPGAEH